MNASARTKRPWDTLEYQRIVTAEYRDGELIVRFADGTEARLSPRCLLSPDVPNPDWTKLRAEEFHLVVPIPAGEIEIPWDVIRVHSDPAFDAFWAEFATESDGSGKSQQRVEAAG
jgi:hypothetical protein